MASWVFFTFCFVNCIIFLSLKHLSWSSSLRPPGNLRRVSLRKDYDRSPKLLPQDLLSQFLSTLNLTEQTGKRRAQNEPPEYMLELYERFTKDRTAVPSANIVRSFKSEDSSPYRKTTEGVRIYPLLFNISIPLREDVTLAELRFFIQIQQAQGAHQDPDFIATVYHVQEGVGWSREVQRDVRSSAKEEVLEIKDLEELVTKHINTSDNGWVSFDLTQAVTHWQKSGCANHRLEVHVTNLGWERKDTTGMSTDLDQSSAGKHKAAVIVFSKNQDKDHYKDTHKLNLIEQQDFLRNERGSLSRQLNHNTDHENQGEQLPLVELHSNFIYDTPSRIRRNVKSEACKRTPLFVDFKDIKWDTWIIQPLGYEVTPTRHAMVQTLLSVKSPDRVSRACCVPTKLEPISLLYHENGVITFNHKYEGMVVAECGCR
uniref:Bone morphogenetic protein 10, like n=1 Tax=Neogobius melanostomus TaxID=47308 RepID=A0A8C6U3D3_9GOBI